MGFVSDIFEGAPDPIYTAAPVVSDTIQQQQDATQVSQYTPYGNLVYGTYGEDGAFIPRESGQALQVTESPFQQEFRGISEDIALQLAGNLDPNLTGFRSAGDIESLFTYNDYTQEAQRIEDETFAAAQRRLEPMIEQERNDLVQSLADRGIPLTSEAAQKELDRFDQSVQDRNSDAAYQAIGAGRDEQTRLAQLRAQELNEQFSLANLEQQQRAQQFGEIGALGGFASPFQPLNAPTVDVAGIINQGHANALASNNAYNGLQQQNYSNNLGFTGDLVSAGGQVAGSYFSDERLKENIEYVGIENGHKVYDFNYIGDGQRWRGVMAQDILQTKPEAVKVMQNGFYGVFYDMLGLKMEAVV